MPSEVFQLYLLLSLKDMASGGLDRYEARLRATGKEGRVLLRNFQDLRAEMSRDWAIAGAGVGTLMLMNKGVKVAGDYESAMTTLKMSIQEVDKETGRINSAKLSQDYGQLESIAVRLGNKLPGTTQDFVEMMSTLKQGGVETKPIIDGVGESVANLAIITRQRPQDLAEPFAQYVQQFQLTGKEAQKLSDVLGRIQFATGLKPQELIEGSKFFQLRAGATLGLKGLEGADVGGRLLALLRSYGLEGGIGGRELGSFVIDLGFNKKEQITALDELRKTKGIELKFFGKKGEFLGVENMFQQMEKLRALNPEERLQFGEKAFNRETLGIMNTMITAGDEGWAKINDRINKIPSQQELINQKTADYNAKLESLQGTMTNLTATAFTPMLDTLKPILDTTNDIVGAVQGWAKEHPNIAKYGTTIVGIGGVTLALYRTLRAGQVAWGLWRIASSLALKGTAADALVAQGAVSKVGTPIKIAIIAGELLIVLEKARELKQIIDEVNRKDKEIAGSNAANYTRLVDLKSKGEATPQFYRLHAQTALMELNREGSLSRAFRGSTANVTEPVRSYFNIPEKGTGFEKTASALWGFATFGPVGRAAGVAPQYHPFYDASAGDRVNLFRSAAPALQQPEVMAEFIKAVQGLKDKGWDEPARKGVIDLAKEAFPESFKRSFELMATQFPEFASQIQKSNEELMRLNQPLTIMPTQMTNAGVAAQQFADRVNALDLSQPTFGAPNTFGTTVPAGPGVMVVLSKASGGKVIKGGLVRVHADEDIVPARVTERWREPPALRLLNAPQRFADRVNTLDFAQPRIGAPNMFGRTVPAGPGVIVVNADAQRIREPGLAEPSALRSLDAPQRFSRSG